MKSLFLALAALTVPQLCVASPQGKSAVTPSPSTVSIFVREDLNTGDVRAFDEATGIHLPTPAGLAGIRILPIDFVGRTDLLEFAPERPRYLTDVPSASRLVLPNGWGALYRFSRVVEYGKVYGFMHIDRHGAARAIAERGVSARAGGVGPYLPLISVSPAGDSFLVATTRNNGGNVYEVSLRDGSMINRTLNFGPMRVERFGLGLQRDWGVIVARRGVLRFTRSAQETVPAATTVVPIDRAHNYRQGDIVFSMNGEWAVTLVGTDSDHLHVWSFSRDGVPQRVSGIAKRFSGAGFLPDSRGGPFLAVSDDGMLAAWVDDGDTSSELHMGRGPAYGARDSEQVTRLQYFDDTLDEIGQTAFFRPDRLTFLAGAKDYIHEGMNQADVFVAKMPENSESLDIVNLSLSSGELEPPFVDYGEIDPDRVVWSAYEDRVLIYDGQEHNALYSVDLETGGLEVVLDEVDSLEMMIVTRQGVLFDVRRLSAGGGQHELFRVDSLRRASPPVLVQSAPVEIDFVRPAVRRDGWISFVSVDTDGHAQILSKVNVGSGAFQSFALTSQSYGPALGYTKRGSVLFSLESSGATSYMLWPFGSSQAIALEVSTEAGFVLPPF